MTVKLFRNMHLVTPVDFGSPSCGTRQGEVREVYRGALLCENGMVAAAGSEEDILKLAECVTVHEEADLEGACVIPGFVDPHTHMCFGARREKEFKMRLEGVPYLDILARGGGILSSVNSVKEASDDELFTTTWENATNALMYGTTTVEIKSGYGLDTATELRMLGIIDRVSRATPQDVVPTFMGAHAVPQQYKERSDDFVMVLCDEMIPAVVRQGIAKYCDVFCETGVFSVEQSRRILQAAAAEGLALKIHADEVHDLGGAGLAAELKTVSAEHLLAASDDNLRHMAENGVIGVLLPATAYSLKKPYARAAAMIDLGVPLALATDCNPGSCFCESMPFIFGLGVMNMGMTVEQALVASTLNAAYAIGMNGLVGSLEAGKQADFIILDGETPAFIAYHAGSNPISQVYKRAERVA